MSKNNGNGRLTKKEWAGVATVAAAGATVAGPLGAAGAAIGVTAGIYAAKSLGWGEDEASSDKSS
jgi:hypothetical protein